MADSTKFVQLVDSLPCLYNNILAEYSKKDVTERAWASIGAEMNWSVADCKEKWKNLRNGLVRILKPSPSGSSAKAKKLYYLHDVMEFVLPYVRSVHHSENTSNIKLPKRAEDNSEEVETSSNADDDNSGDVPPPSGYKHNNDLESHPVNENHSGAVCKRPQSTILSAKKSKKITQERDEVDVAVLDYIKSKKESIPSEAGRTMFLMSLLPDIRCLSGENLRRFKIRAMLLLEEILNEQRQQSASRKLFEPAPLYCQNIEVCTPALSPDDAPTYISVL